MKKRTETAGLKVGDKLSRISFMTVTGFGFGGREVQVTNEDGFEWGISNRIIEEECYAANQFTEEVKVSKTELAEILMSAKDAVVTVNFHKQANAESIQNRIGELVTMSRSAANKNLTALLKGEERTLIGYVLGAEPVLGRTIVIDLEKEKVVKPTKDGKEWDARQRQVDHRSLNWMIYKNVKYIVK